MPKDTWSKEQVEFLKDHLEKLTFKEIGEKINKSELAVHLYVLRKRIPVGHTVVRNLVIEILRIKFVKPEYFHPTRSFYTDVQITQKRWWDLYLGRAPVTEPEYFRLVVHFQVSLKDAFEARQLKIFEE
jgi:hypothetical protein